MDVLGIVPERLTVADVVRVGREGQPVELTAPSRRRMEASRALVERQAAEGRIIYGINTGLGRLKDQVIPADALLSLQANLIRSHASGVGPPLDPEATRATTLLLLCSLARGHSGVRVDLAETLIRLLNAGVCPVIPSQGSVGASGDLAPLAHLALVLMGEGEAVVAGQRLPGGEALARAGIPPLRPGIKEGLALTNGTHVMTAIGALVLADAARLAVHADVAAAMSLEATMGTDAAADPAIHRLRPHPGQGAVARNLRRLLQGSGILASHRDCPRVQDAYSIRCIPQVHGASRDALAYARGVLDVELNAVTDNPLVEVDGAGGRILYGGNFHGQPVALALDVAAMAVAELGGISERRIERLVNPALSDGLPAFLTTEGGLRSGYMIPQYVAAALVSESKTLCHPASVDSIPTSANQEDHVSMGPIAALKARRVADNVEQVLAIEFLCAAQALEFRVHLGRPGPGTGAAQAAIRKVVPRLGEDRPPAPDIAAVREMLRAGTILDAVRAVAPDLE